MALYALGSNGSGQLGLNHKEDVSVPKPVIFEPEPSNRSITKIAAGGNHTLIFFQSGELYWAGDATSGACGLTSDVVDPERSIFRPATLSNSFKGKKICNVAATWEASLVVIEDDDDGGTNSVYSLGAGQKGELGLGSLAVEVVRTPSATLIPGFPPTDAKVVDIAACMAHVVAVLDNGEVYGWGNGRKGQLGAPAEVVQAPRKIADVGFKVSRALCGREFTCLVGAPETGEILILGSDKWDIKVSCPKSITNWKDVGAGWSNMYVLQEDGTLVSWGRDDHGQMVPPKLPTISKMAIGSEHAVCLAESGEVLSWGWGEHGNCGPSAQNDIKGRWNTIASEKYMPSDLKITDVGAGCATSWVNIILR